MSNLSEAQMTKLATIVAATNSGTGMVYMTEKSVKLLLDAGYVECNTEMTEGNKVAVRSTTAGDNALVAPQTETGTTTMDNTTKFSIETGVSIPAIKRMGGAKASPYPFGALEIGQSFFVPATEDMPNPGKSLASTVSSASKRYATEAGTRTINRRPKLTNDDGSPMLGEDGKQIKGELQAVEVPAYVYERKFMVRTVEENGMSGARVWRIEPTGEAE